eukprot:TRINITY_DN440_c0_g1_i4.p1 TRINITY_DN440_c0_g1~~TRINITY_DN440_c0_g1_i4.p1  ORF type:complete len:103 (-),score=20.30 TRINITY_DN440_c0_g1_i4:50-358(-)
MKTVVVMLLAFCCIKLVFATCAGARCDPGESCGDGCSCIHGRITTYCVHHSIAMKVGEKIKTAEEEKLFALCWNTCNGTATVEGCACIDGYQVPNSMVQLFV